MVHLRPIPRLSPFFLSSLLMIMAARSCAFLQQHPTGSAGESIHNEPPFRRSLHASRVNKNEEISQATAWKQAQDMAEQTELKQELFQLLEKTPANAPTPRALTESLLQVVRNLEQICPTPNGQVREKLSGNWELVWTTQDKTSEQFRNTIFSWINPLEDQSYSNNPNGSEGRLNPVLPRPIQDQLERMGFIQVDATSDDATTHSNNSNSINVKSTQSIDLQRGRVRNVVSFGVLLPGQRPPVEPQRASLIVDISILPHNPLHPRRVHVKFDACRVTVAKTPIDITLPLGLLGPSGWLETNYIDDNLRITRGHKGSVFVLQRPQ